MSGNSQGITRIDGSWFWPTTALISFFGTVSFVLTLLLRSSIPGPLGEWLPVANLLFGTVALFTSILGLFSILLCGVGNIGGLTYRGEPVGKKLVGYVYLALYLPGSLLVLITVGIYCLGQ